MDMNPGQPDLSMVDMALPDGDATIGYGYNPHLPGSMVDMLLPASLMS